MLLESSSYATNNSNLSKSDFQQLQKIALKKGADKAIVISASDVLVDPRVRLKCMIPKCYMSGVCSHCPPHGYSIQETRDIVSGYEKAIFFRVGVKSSIIAAKSLYKAVESGVMDKEGNAMNLGGHYILVFSIVKILEKKALEMGYQKTHGFAAGNCKDPFCHLQPHCQNLMTRKGCRHSELSSHSMESSGIDVFTMAARANWYHYPIGGTCQPDSVPQGNLMGLVLAA